MHEHGLVGFELGDVLHVVECGFVRCRRSALELVVPAFLLKDRFLLVDPRMEHRIEVHVHEVVQVLLVGRGNWVQRLVGKGHGVQERLHRAFQQVDERFLDRVLARTAEHRMLEDVKDARIVLRWSAKSDGE